MRKAKTLTDVVVVMYELNYDFIGEGYQTIGQAGQVRNVLRFERNKKYRDESADIKELQEKISDNFTIEKYCNGRYYHVYRNL